ncbi:MAG: chloride channel protein [Phycisphaerales bacterium]
MSGAANTADSPAAAREADGRLRDITIGLTPYVLALAVACAVGAVAFMRTLETVERAFARLPLPRLLKPVIGAALLGLGGAEHRLHRGE